MLIFLFTVSGVTRLVCMDKLTLAKKKCIFKIDFYFFNITLGQHTYNMEKIGFKVILMTIPS